MPSGQMIHLKEGHAFCLCIRRPFPLQPGIPKERRPIRLPLYSAHKGLLLYFNINSMEVLKLEPWF